MMFKSLLYSYFTDLKLYLELTKLMHFNIEVIGLDNAIMRLMRWYMF